MIFLKKRMLFLNATKSWDRQLQTMSGLTKREQAQRAAVRNTNPLSTYFSVVQKPQIAPPPPASSPSLSIESDDADVVVIYETDTAEAATTPAVVDSLSTSTQSYTQIELPDALRNEQTTLSTTADSCGMHFTWVLRGRMAFGRSVSSLGDPVEWLGANRVRLYIDASGVIGHDRETMQRMCERALCMFLHIPIDTKHKITGKSYTDLLALVAAVVRCFNDNTFAVYIGDNRGGNSAAVIATVITAVARHCSSLQAAAHVTWCQNRRSANDDAMKRIVRMLPESEALREATEKLVKALRQRNISSMFSSAAAAASSSQESDGYTSLRALLALPAVNIVSSSSLAADNVQAWLVGDVAAVKPVYVRRSVAAMSPPREDRDRERDRDWRDKKAQRKEERNAPPPVDSLTGARVERQYGDADRLVGGFRSRTETDPLTGVVREPQRAKWREFLQQKKGAGL